jgi:nucleoside 2-deoxyribosyltransferase
MRIYLAAGWFSEEQEQARLEVLSVLKTLVCDFYSPKDHGEGVTDEVFQKNLDYVSTADYIVASTEGKDMGTLFECGYAFRANVPIIYYFRGSSLNLMLAKSAYAVCHSPDDLLRFLKSPTYRPYIGDME